VDKTQLDLNASACIQSANSVGHTTYTNICSGTVHVVQWGSLDWLGFAVAMGFLAALVTGMAIFIYCIMVSD
jgi:hypothetical protein